MKPPFKSSPVERNQRLLFPSNVFDLLQDDHEPVEVAFQLRDDSAVPLALPGQWLLGGKALSAEDLMDGEGLHVAVATSDGQQVFKRVGRPIFPGRGDIRLFESIGGRGNSVALALEESVAEGGIPFVVSARLVLGVIYLA